MRNLFCPLKTTTKSEAERINKELSLRAPYGILVLQDVIDDVDPESKLIISLESKKSFKTSDNTALAGVVVYVAENFIDKYTGGVTPSIGDRILTISNKVIPIPFSDKNGETYQLLLIKEDDILAIIDNNTKLKV